MKKKVLLFMSTLLAAAPVVSASSQSTEASVEQTAKELALKIVSDYGVSGIQYALRDHGAVVLLDGAGVHDKATKAPVTKDTMFGIGSTSKVYVTAAAMKLADRGLIDIDKPLTTYVKDFKMADERYKNITPRMLMNHSSGLYGSHFEDGFLFDDNDTEAHDELLDRLRSGRLKADPGAFSVYCNDGFQLLEIMIERVSGLSYSKFLQTHFSLPLGLNATKTPRDSFDRDRLASVYLPPSEQALPVENVNLIGTGGIYSTAEEVSKFGDVLIGNRTDLLSEKSVKAMQSHEYRKGFWVPEETNSFNYGLGWDAVQLAPFDEYGITALSKGGDTTMYHASLITLPEHDLSMAVLSSGGSSIYNSILATKTLLAYAKTKGIIDEILPDKTFEPAVKVDMPTDLQAYAGLYVTLGQMVDVQFKNGEIVPELSDGFSPPQKFMYTGNGQFKSNDGSATVSFERADNGKTYMKFIGYASVPGIGQSAMATYSHQKLDRNPLDQATKQAWEARNGKTYYPLDEKITAIGYLTPSFMTKQFEVNTDFGYASGTKIISGNKAVNVAQMPIMHGRDTFDLNFYTKQQKEYLTIGGQAYIREDAIPTFTLGSGTLRLHNDQAAWFKIDKKFANRQIIVKAPASGGFAVYDAKGATVHFSKVHHKDSVVLPEGGLLVFGGNKGDVFSMKVK
ncbi:serine hydrolase domain-containing protein [Paenibacillus xanthanilyticus]|uniref:Serine hydrolase domain-containing protein n=1 Tax=Paenibacillus xanthanilyticus TaxID=1783531 RepID=A0ABV8K064_9BACL